MSEENVVVSGSDGSVQISSLVSRVDAQRATQRGADLIVLPIRRDTDGRGVYPDATTFLVKELKAEGVDAAFLDESADRFFLVQNSAIDLLNEIVVGVISSAAWEGLRRLLTKRASKTPLTITYLDLSPDGKRQEFTASGPSDAVLEAIDRLRVEGHELDDGA